ncbi:hypothetical protein [Mycobacterium sp. URHB0021]
MLTGPPPTATEVCAVFEEVLAGFAAGESPAVIPCYGFDTPEVLVALDRVRNAAPNPPAALVEAARYAFDHS